MLKKIALVLVVLIVGILVYAATRPDQLHVERSATINAPASEIYPHITNFRKWAAWSPYEKLDPAMQKTYGGSATGRGAVYEWKGNSDAGDGRMEITDTAEPSRVAIKLDFIAPFEGHNVTTFALTPQGDTTQVTWAMDGPTPYVAKVMGVFVDMDSMLGSDFEAGLANLKAIAEKR